jgi:UDP-N-acetylglucosamine:LPS N-acetylglucosamine transferase
MGAGHDGAARELARRLELDGHVAVIVDFLDAFPRPLALAWRSFYLLQLRFMPESYESSYQMFYKYPRLWAPFVRFERALAGRRTMRWVEMHRPDVVISTYSFATLVLGRLREEGKLTAPIVNFLTDFGVHPRAVHPAVDLHLAVHPIAAAAAAARVTAPVLALGPAVRPVFRPDSCRRAKSRAELGVGDGDCLVVVSAGSWGIGDIERTVSDLVSAGRFTVVTVCGSDHRLRARLARRRLGMALGWVENMADLFAAADVVVENAGGLSSLEAFATGTPVISYRPIPGHGRDNVAAMAAAGVTCVPSDREGLLDAVDRLGKPGPARDAQLAAAAAMFVGDPAGHIARRFGSGLPPITALRAQPAPEVDA